MRKNINLPLAHRTVRFHGNSVGAGHLSASLQLVWSPVVCIRKHGFKSQTSVLQTTKAHLNMGGGVFFLNPPPLLCGFKGKPEENPAIKRGTFGLRAMNALRPRRAPVALQLFEGAPPHEDAPVPKDQAAGAAALHPGAPTCGKREVKGMFRGEPARCPPPKKNKQKQKQDKTGGGHKL